jgi:hypothetical protein
VIWQVFICLRTGFANESFQPFRFVERPAVRGFITYLNHKLRDDDIPHKSGIASAVDGRVFQLEELTVAIVNVRPPICQIGSLRPTNLNQ